MLSTQAFFSWHREFKNVSTHHCQLANHSGGGAGLIRHTLLVLRLKSNGEVNIACL